MQAHGVVVELLDVGARRPRQHVGFPGAEAVVLAQLVAEVQASGQHGQGAAHVGTDHHEVREPLEAAGEDEAREGKGGVEGPSDHFGQPEDLHVFRPDGHPRRVHEQRHVEVGHQLEERHGVGRVQVLSGDARVDHDPLEAVFAHRPLGLLEELVAAERHRARQPQQEVGVFCGGFGRERVELRHDVVGVFARGRADPVVAEDRQVHPGALLLVAQTRDIEDGLRRLGVVPALGYEMGMSVDDHGTVTNVSIAELQDRGPRLRDA